MSVRLADRSFQYPVGIAENMLIEVGKFTFPADFIILEMEKDCKVPLILEDDFDALLDEGSKILHSIEGTLLEEEIFAEFDEFMAMTADENSVSELTCEIHIRKYHHYSDYNATLSKNSLRDLKLKPFPDNLE
ncbi:hypothetical protein Tco_1215841 [Tanacetum coccineum]